MFPLAITALTAVSALGLGRAAQGQALAARRSGLTPNDYEPAVGGWIGRVAGVEEWPAQGVWDCRNNRLAAMALDQDGFRGQVAAAVARYGAGRVALVLGTSTSGIASAEAAFAARGPDGALPPGFDYARTHDMQSLAGFCAEALGVAGPALVVSTACASTARCFLDAAQLIAAGFADAAVVGGADSLCRMTLQGFAALELVSPEPCQPCGSARSGISIGEAAGFALLERGGPPGGLALLGAGASSDGHHMSAPHPEGAGAIAAMCAALEAAGLEGAQMDWVHLHGTGTRQNDAVEDQAVAAVCGRAVPASSTKAYSGHTLGACGILGVALAAEAMSRGFVPGCLGIAVADPDFAMQVAVANLARPVRHVLANAFGFGGTNCSLVLGQLP
jgi:3-oxoacyl-[acyl-carrier-protein] synthase-1